MTNLRTRIAPTPSGWLHPGNGISFLFTWALARSQGAGIWLRIDDLDTERSRPEYIEDIFRTIDWLGIDYDQGPTGPDDFNKRFSQHLRLDLYQNNLDILRNKGYLYACSCSRKAIRDLSGSSVYPGICRDKGLDMDGAGVAWRVRIEGERVRGGESGSGGDFEKNDSLSIRLQANQSPSPPVTNSPGLQITQSARTRSDKSPDHQVSQSPSHPVSKSPSHQLPTELGDFLVRQKNGLPAYQIASLSDDLLWDINLIIRGEDLLASTAAQCYLAECLGRPEFCNHIFVHHPLIRDESGEKLSKSKGAGSLKAWREAGRTPGELVRAAARWLGVGEEGLERAGDLLG